jgi:hypothetical protein
MNATDRYVPRDHNVAAEDFDGEFVVLDLNSGKYFSLAGAAAIVWKGLTSGHSVASLVAGLAEGDERRAGAERVAQELLAFNLLRADGTATGGPPEIAAELAAASGGFEVQSFDDLADLLIADPIHDVDAEAGWPHKPDQN